MAIVIMVSNHGFLLGHKPRSSLRMNAVMEGDSDECGTYMSSWVNGILV